MQSLPGTGLKPGREPEAGLEAKVARGGGVRMASGLQGPVWLVPHACPEGMREPNPSTGLQPRSPPSSRLGHDSSGPCSLSRHLAVVNDVLTRCAGPGGRSQPEEGPSHV